MLVLNSCKLADATRACHDYLKFSNSISLLLIILIFQNTVEPPFNVLQFKVFPYLSINLNDFKSIISVLNYLHLIFSSVQCSNPLLLKETLHKGFTVIILPSFKSLYLITNVWDCKEEGQV
jgi:hypothetical protein